MNDIKVEIGDIVFIQISNFLYRRVAEISHSWTSHVGIVVSEDGANSIIVESRIPRSSTTTLEKFIRRSNKGMYSIKRLKSGLTLQQKNDIINKAGEKLGILYHLGFDLESPRQFCSKFVEEVYVDALGVRIGRIETFNELLNKNSDYPLWFWRLWFLGRIPWNRKTITPGSQYESNSLMTVSEKI